VANSQDAIVVGVDTQTLIWALDELVSDDPAKEQRALWLMRQLTVSKAQVIVSTIIVGELLVGIEPAKHADFIESLRSRFQIVPFDVRGASKAAEEYSKNLDLKVPGEGARKTFRADLCIAAQAWASGATQFFSDDARCRKFAERMGMRARPLPEHAPTTGTQSDLFPSE
jgi:predicted nucleic acid-binding protein